MVSSDGGSSSNIVASAVAPFGRIGRVLGFRWLFPIGTMPIPFHPLILWALLIGIPLAIGWQLVATMLGDASGSGPRWIVPFVAALLLGIPLSIPIVSWFMMVIAGPLLQAMLFGGSMLLLIADIAVGRADPRLAVLPAAFLLLYLVQAIGGRWQLASLRRKAARWAPVEPFGHQVRVAGNGQGDPAKWMSAYAIDRLALDNGEPVRNWPKSFTHHWIGEKAAHLLEDGDGFLPQHWQLSKVHPILSEPGIEYGIATLDWSARRFRSPLWLLAGDLWDIRIQGDALTRRLVVGEAAVIDWLPRFTLFHWTAIFGGRSQWVAGFARRKVERLGSETDPWRASFSARVEGHESTTPPALFERLEAARRRDRDQVDSYFALLRDEPDKINFGGRHVWELTRHSPQLLDGHGPATAAALTFAKEHRLVNGVSTAATFLQRLGEKEWQAARGPIIEALSSRMLACRWKLTASTSIDDIPNGTPRFGNEAGYGLVRSHAALYERLASFGPEGERLLERIKEEVAKAASPEARSAEA